MTGLFFIRANRTQSRVDYALAGLFLGLAYLHRITTLYIGLPLLIWAIWKKEWYRGYVNTFIAFIFVVGIESAFFASTQGDPLTRFHVLTTRSAAATGISTPIRPGGKMLAPIASLASNQEFGFPL